MGKRYKELNFADNFMFCKVMTANENICRHVLELILGKKIKRVNFKSAEHIIELKNDAHAIRMDVYGNFCHLHMHI